MGNSQPSFDPYLRYQKNLEYIANFSQLTDLAYGLTLQLLFKHPRNDGTEVHLPETGQEKPSYSMADVSFRIVRGWLTLSEYAEYSNLEFETVKRDAHEGKLGPVLKHPKSGEEIIIWPSEMQSVSLSEFLEPGNYEVGIIADQQATLSLDITSQDKDNFDQVQQIFLSLAHSLGEPDRAIVQAREMLFQSCFLIQWTAFEVFLRSTVQELMKMHPTKLAAGKRGKQYNLNYKERLNMGFKEVICERNREAIS